MNRFVPLIRAGLVFCLLPNPSLASSAVVPDTSLHTFSEQALGDVLITIPAHVRGFPSDRTITVSSLLDRIMLEGPSEVRHTFRVAGPIWERVKPQLVKLGETFPGLMQAISANDLGYVISSTKKMVRFEDHQNTNVVTAVMDVFRTSINSFFNHSPDDPDYIKDEREMKEYRDQHEIIHQDLLAREELIEGLLSKLETCLGARLTMQHPLLAAMRADWGPPQNVERQGFDKPMEDGALVRWYLHEWVEQTILQYERHTEAKTSPTAILMKRHPEIFSEEQLPVVDEYLGYIHDQLRAVIVKIPEKSLEFKVRLIKDQHYDSAGRNAPTILTVLRGLPDDVQKDLMNVGRSWLLTNWALYRNRPKDPKEATFYLEAHVKIGDHIEIIPFGPEVRKTRIASMAEAFERHEDYGTSRWLSSRLTLVVTAYLEGTRSMSEAISDLQHYEHISAIAVEALLLYAEIALESNPVRFPMTLKDLTSTPQPIFTAFVELFKDPEVRGLRPSLSWGETDVRVEDPFPSFHLWLKNPFQKYGNEFALSIQYSRQAKPRDYQTHVSHNLVHAFGDCTHLDAQGLLTQVHHLLATMKQDTRWRRMVEAA